MDFPDMKSEQTYSQQIHTAEIVKSVQRERDRKGILNSYESAWHRSLMTSASLSDTQAQTVVMDCEVLING